MPFYDPEVIERARQVDLFTYLQAREPQELVHVSGNLYCTREHDSLRISNGKWCWFSRGIGGYSALDYLIKVKGCSFLEAMEAVTGRAAIPPPSRAPVSKEEKPRHLLLPQPAPDNRAMMAYLRGRGIDPEILDYCVQTGRIYESRNKGHGNVVFVGFDQTGKARFGCLRGIGEARFHGDLSGSDKHYSFALPACVKNPAVHLCECAIDVMSYATLCKLEGIDWRRHNLLSLAGVYQPKKKKRSQRSSRPCTARHFSWKENLINVRAGCSIQKNTAPARSIWNFLKHILKSQGSRSEKMYIWV